MNLTLYSVSDEYIRFLRSKDSNVYSNKENNRTHSRKYLGVVYEIESYRYFIPLSSPKSSDYQKAGDGYVIKKSIVPIIRLVNRDRKGNKQLIGTLRVSHMIPVPDSELEKYDVNSEIDERYKSLIQDELMCIRRNSDRIISNARLLYKQKSEGDTSAGYVKTALDFKKIESYCDMWEKLRG